MTAVALTTGADTGRPTFAAPVGARPDAVARFPGQARQGLAAAGASVTALARRSPPMVTPDADLGRLTFAAPVGARLDAVAGFPGQACSGVGAAGATLDELVGRRALRVPTTGEMPS